MNPVNPVIETINLTKSYGGSGQGQEALASLNLTIPNGSALALLGRNGAGKTTLLRLLMNLLKPTRGRVKIFGKDVADLTEADRARIGYVADNQRLPEGMLVEEFLSYLRPFYPTWDQDFALSLCQRFELPLQRNLRHLSRGQRMKASFVAALAFHPQLLIMDEPFGGLDPAVRDEVLDAIFALMSQEQWTLIVSSHEIDEVERLADQVLILDAGKVALREEKDALLSQCRAISFHSSSAFDKAKLPSTWWDLRCEEGRFNFVDRSHDAAAFKAVLAESFPDAQHVTIQPAPLKEITRALLHQRH
jgi:ABC-2 type transport system ATP-binding protein